MATSLPRRVRRRLSALLAAVAAGGLMLGSATVPAVAADPSQDNPEQRVEQADADIAETLENLDQSSTALAEAERELEAAQQQLAAAQDELAEARGELAAAVVLDRRMQRALERAVGRLRRAREGLAASRADLAEQEEKLGQIAVQNYQQGDPSLLGLAMVLDSEDPADLTSQLNSVQNVLDKESVTLDRLDATRLVLTAQAQQVEDAKAEVARKRAAAARNLRQKRELEERAVAAEEGVARLVSAKAEAQRAAEAARDADLARLRALQQERGRVAELLAARAEAARSQAAAAAAAAASSGLVATSSNGVTGFLDHPVTGYITSPYGMRVHPIYHQLKLHDGTDFGAACGTPIRAAAAGEVIAVYYNAGYGNRVIIDHGFHRGVGLGTAYNHLSGYSTSVGERVERGEVIGYVGSTGYSTGCHLHFMVFENGATVNPMFWL